MFYKVNFYYLLNDKFFFLNLIIQKIFQNRQKNKEFPNLLLFSS